MSPILETWRGAFTLDEQERFLFLRQHNFCTGFLVGLEPQYIAEWRALSAKLHRFCEQLLAVETS